MEKKIKEGIPFIKEWIETKKELFNDNTNFKELIIIIDEIEKEQDFSQDSFENIRSLLRLFEYIPLRIKRIFNIGTLHNYCAFIASRHFESIEDFINLEIGVKRFNGNMTKFFYNPIPLTERTIQFFPYLRTQFIYYYTDKVLKNPSIRKYEIQENSMNIIFSY